MAETVAAGGQYVRAPRGKSDKHAHGFKRAQYIWGANASSNMIARG